jgi:hypothetical protein
MLPRVPASHGIGLRAWRTLSVLAVERLATSWTARFARLAGWCVALGFAGWVVATRASQGAGHATVDALRLAAHAATWAGAALVGFAAAGGRGLRDRTSGFEAMAITQGCSERDVAHARVLGAAALGARALAWPVLVVALVALATTARAGALRAQLGAAAVTLGYALVTGAGLGALGAASDWLAPRRGRALYVGVIVGSAALAELIGDPRIAFPSGPGLALDRALHASTSTLAFAGAH